MSSHAVHPMDEKVGYPIEPGMASKNGGSTEVLEKDPGQPERGNWTGKLDFLLSCLGYAVGLGNVWRFPYLCYRNGGGAFLIPYTIMLFFIGIPIFFLELSIGQYGQLGPVTLFRNLCPLFQGVGYAMMISTAFVAIYYNMIIAWTFFYLFDSFRSDVPWKYCDYDFNSPNCFRDQDYKECIANDANATYLNHTCFNSNISSAMNLTTTPEKLRVSPPEEYLNGYMLAKSTGLFDIGGIRWQLAVCLLAAWVVIFFCLIKGIKSSGRVVYFTATFPYVVLFILLIRGVTLDGAAKGIHFYMVPDFSKLMTIGVWKDAAIQIFYSLSVAGGGLITLSSYNKFHNNVLRDTLIVCFGNCCTSIIAGFVVFSVLGFMATQLNVPVADVVKSGPGLAFIVYPDAVSRMPVSPLWAILFFLMLFTLGLDSQFAIVENLLTCVMDEAPKLRRWKTGVVFTICCLGLILGLPLTTNGGIYVLDLMDNYAAGWPYLFCGMMECIVIGYFYGIDKFFHDVKQMIGWVPNFWVRSHINVLYLSISPLIICLILLINWIKFEPATSGDYVYDLGGNAIGFCMALLPIMVIVVSVFYQLFFSHRGLNFGDRYRVLTTPTEIWRKAAKENGQFSHNAAEYSHNQNAVDVIRSPTNYNKPYAAYDNPVAYDYETHM